MNLYDALDASQPVNGVQVAKCEASNVYVSRFTDSKRRIMFDVSPIYGRGRFRRYQGTQALERSLNAPIFDGWEPVQQEWSN